MAKDATAFSFETVVVLVAVLLKNGGTLGINEYKVMSALNGNRSASGFDHLFRKVKTRAKELQDQLKGGEVGTPVKRTKGGSKAATPATGEKSSGKRSRKERTDDDEDESPSKKVKNKEDNQEEDGGFFTVALGE